MDIAPSDHDQEDGSQKPSTSDKAELVKRIVLRLDSGAVIGHAERLQINGGKQSSVVCLSMEEAFHRGYVGKAEQERLQRLVSTAQQLAPEVFLPAKPVAALSNETPFKRVALEVDASAPATVPGSAPTDRPRQLQDCARVLSYVAKSLSNTKNMFWNRVNESEAPNYYTIVQRPITLGEIDQKLKANIYGDAEEFATDMRQVWENCRIYNRPNDWVYQAGVKASQRFEQRWADVQRQWKLGLTTRPSDAIQLSTVDSMALEGAASQHSLEPRRSLRARIPNSLFGVYDNEEEAKAAIKSSRGARPSMAGGSSMWTADKLDKLHTALNDLSQDLLSQAYNIIMNDPRYTSQDGGNHDDGIELSELASDTLRRLDQFLRRCEQRPSSAPRPSKSGRRSCAGGSPGHTSMGSAGQGPSSATLSAVAALSLQRLGEEIANLQHDYLSQVVELLKGTPYLGVDESGENELLIEAIDAAHLAKLQAIVAHAWEDTAMKKPQASQPRGAVVLDDVEEDSDDDDDDSD